MRTSSCKDDWDLPSEDRRLEQTGAHTAGTRKESIEGRFPCPRVQETAHSEFQCLRMRSVTWHRSETITLDYSAFSSKWKVASSLSVPKLSTGTSIRTANQDFTVSLALLESTSASCRLRILHLDRPSV